MSEAIDQESFTTLAAAGSGQLHSGRRQRGGLFDWQKEFNTEVNKIRWMIEQVISHFKELDRHAHRLSPPDQHVHDNYLSGNWPAFLPDGLNNPHTIFLTGYMGECRRAMPSARQLSQSTVCNGPRPSANIIQASD